MKSARFYQRLSRPRIETLRLSVQDSSRNWTLNRNLGLDRLKISPTTEIQISKVLNSNQNQHFFLSDGGVGKSLIPRKCSTKAVSVTGSCRDGAVLKLQNNLGRASEFKVGIDGTISSGE